MTDKNEYSPNETMEDFRKRMEKLAETGETPSAHDQVTMNRMAFCLEVATSLGGKKLSHRDWVVLTAASVIAIPSAEEIN
jgi:hypothetical protein